ncbi:hypothetical protein SUGI_1079200 [Cryptomeria japonica]|nr:hypothetical protein SUGI_1079200 [Cryptomeria japonica]
MAEQLKQKGRDWITEEEDSVHGVDRGEPLQFTNGSSAIHQRLLSNGSPRSTPACNLFQPRATPPLSHHQAVAREVSISCSCVQPQPALPTEEVDTSFVAYLPPRKPCPTTPLGVNSSHSLQSCPYVFSAPPPPALDLGTLPRSAPIINPISNWETKLVVNLSPAHIDPLAFNFLKRGLNFALTPRNIPHIDFLIEIENAVRTLPLDVAEEVRQDCAVALRYAKPPKFNIPKAELLAFNNLMHNNDLIISRADKGNATQRGRSEQRGGEGQVQHIEQSILVIESALFSRSDAHRIVGRIESATLVSSPAISKRRYRVLPHLELFSLRIVGGNNRIIGSPHLELSF